MRCFCDMLTLGIFSVMTMQQALALQVVAARDGVSVEAVLSLKEPTRIRIDGAPITNVFGNIYASHCGDAGSNTGSGIVSGNTLNGATVNGLSNGSGNGLSSGLNNGLSNGAPLPITPLASAISPVNPQGELIIECDSDKGEVYVRPVQASVIPPSLNVSQSTGTPSAMSVIANIGKPLTLFVSSARATYTLVLRRSDTPADTIVIRDPNVRSLDGDAADARSRASSSDAWSTSSKPARQGSHVRRIKNLLVAMASSRDAKGLSQPKELAIEPPNPAAFEGWSVQTINRPIQLWQEASFRLTHIYEGRGLIGERYQLTNISAAPMVLAEQEFDRENAGVLGVSIEHHNLRPGESTQVYVIRQGGAP